MSWMSNAKLSDADRVAQAIEVKPGLMAGPWERGSCQFGRAFKFRWTWRPGLDETIESGKPEGTCGCKKCNPREKD